MDTILFFTDLYAGSRIPVLRGAKECVIARNRQVQVIELARVNVSIPETLSFWKPEGCLVEGSAHIRPSKRLFGDTPVVYLDPNEKILADNPSHTVMADNSKIADCAFETLLKSNIRHFAFVGWTLDVNWSAIRLASFRKSVEAHGGTCDVFLDPWTIGDAARFTERISPWLCNLPCPCGVFAANDDIASVILTACSSAGVRVPDDIAVVGVDDDESVCETTKPTLSSVKPDFLRCGYLAADMLLRIAEGKAAPEEHLLVPPSGATLRQSSRKLAKTNPKISAALDLIRREATSGIKAADVVKFLDMSERLAEARFKEATGRRITEEITEVRLEKVLDLLRMPNQSITPIANLCGWGSDIYLKRLFKSRFGMTMREWRESHAGTPLGRPSRNIP